MTDLQKQFFEGVEEIALEFSRAEQERSQDQADLRRKGATEVLGRLLRWAQVMGLANT